MNERSDIFEVMPLNSKFNSVAFIVILLLSSHLSSQRMICDGLTVVAPPKPFTIDPFDAIDDVGSDWISLVPYSFTRLGQTEVHFDTERQWWGERTVGIEYSIQEAQKHGLKIMLKPQVYIPGGWPGDLQYESEEEWLEWESSYRDFILHWAKVANKHNVEILCVGTEFKVSTAQRPLFWLDLIEEIREVYCGELTYSANWDEYDDISFWSELDYIGVSAYFPLSEETVPEVKDLLKAWKPRVVEFAKVSDKVGKPILFTEYGYLSVNGCCGKTWELEKSVRTLPINQQCQANGIDALLTAFGEQDWWAGGFLWKWFPNGMGHEGYVKRDYTPQNKQAEKTLKKHYDQWH